MFSVYQFVAALAASSIGCFAQAKACPPLGQVLPVPRNPSQNVIVQDAITRLELNLDNSFAANMMTSGISVAVKSIHEDKLLFNYHFTPPVLSGLGTSKINEQTIYRVGSVSKIMPALSVLQSSKVDMQASVLKYLPDLAWGSNADASIHSIPWKDITVQDLANHLSGLSRDTAFDLALIPTGPWTQMGLPAILNGTGPTCSGLPGTKRCSSKDIVDSINRKPLVELSSATPLYSNLGYALLAMVIEAATGQDFGHVAQTGIFDVANMTSTSFNGPVNSFSKVGFIPQGESTWNLTLGVFEAVGGLFSNTIDMISFTESIITNKFLSPRKTREWMKPAAHTSSLGMSVGAPWEILRSNILTSDKRLIDVYTKSGDFGLYHALIAAITDYDLVMTVLTGGQEVSVDQDTRTNIFSTVVRALVPAIDAAARAEASSSNGYTGRYIDKSTNSTLELELDSGSGIVIQRFVIRGFDVLANFPSYSVGSGPSLGTVRTTVDGRMYPVGINSNAPFSQSYSRNVPKNSTSSKYTMWRAFFSTATDAQNIAKDDALFYMDGSCETWFTFDQTAYNYLSLGEFVFVHDSLRSVKAVQSPAFDVTFKKTSL